MFDWVKNIEHAMVRTKVRVNLRKNTLKSPAKKSKI